MRRTLAFLGVTALLLTGCEAAPVYGPSPTPSTPPIFATEEEAVAAVIDLLDAYLPAAEAYGRSGGRDASYFDGLLTARMMADEADYWSENPDVETIDGALTYENLEIQQFDADGWVQAYVCLNIEGSRHHRDGSTVVLSGSHPVEALFESQQGALLLDDFREWTGRDFCAS